MADEYERYLSRFKAEIKEGGIEAVRKLEHAAGTTMRGKTAQAARDAVRHYREDQETHQSAWEKRRSWIALIIAVLALLVAIFKP